MTDEQIVSLFWARDERAIEELAHRHGGLCRAMALRMLGSFQDAEECISDALLAAWNSIPPRRPEKLSAYLDRLTRNQALKRRRDSERLKRGGGELNLAYEELDECLPGPESTEQCWEQRELSTALERFLRGLPEAERRLFLRRLCNAHGSDIRGDLSDHDQHPSGASSRQHRLHGNYSGIDSDRDSFPASA